MRQGQQIGNSLRLRPVSRNHHRVHPNAHWGPAPAPLSLGLPLLSTGAKVPLPGEDHTHGGSRASLHMTMLLNGTMATVSREHEEAVCWRLPGALTSLVGQSQHIPQATPGDCWTPFLPLPSTGAGSAFAEQVHPYRQRNQIGPNFQSFCSSTLGPGSDPD